MKRLDWVDTLKGIGILLMVAGHYPAFTRDGRVLVLIYSFHMPLFLFMGGYLFGDVKALGELGSKIKKSVRTLVVPYFAFCTVSLLLLWPTDAATAAGYLSAIFYGVGTLEHPNLPLWFLTFYFTGRCLFAGILFLSEAVGRRSQKAREWVLAALTILVICVGYYVRLVRYSARLPWNLDMSAICMGFYYVGYQYRKWDGSMKLPGTVKSILCVLLFILWIPAALYGTRVDINASFIGRGLGCFYLAAILGIIWCTQLSRRLSGFRILRDFLSYLGRKSLYIMGLHIPLSFITGTMIIPFMPRLIQLNFGAKTIIGAAFYLVTATALPLMFGGIWEEAKKSIAEKS